MTSPIINSGSGGTIASGNRAGYLKANIDGNRIANALYNNYKFDVWDFDNATGILSNPMTFSWGPVNKTYGVEFSPDGNILYVSAPYEKKIIQYNLLAGSQVNIENSGYTVVDDPLNGGALQLGPDNKIYFANQGSSSLGVISDPNVIGLGCNYTSFWSR